MPTAQEVDGCRMASVGPLCPAPWVWSLVPGSISRILNRGWGLPSEPPSAVSCLSCASGERLPMWEGGPGRLGCAFPTLQLSAHCPHLSRSILQHSLKTNLVGFCFFCFFLFFLLLSQYCFKTVVTTNSCRTASAGCSQGLAAAQP